MTPQEKALKDRIEQIKRANNVHIFPTLVPITRLDGSVGPIDPTQNQRHLLDFLEKYSWTLTCDTVYDKQCKCHDRSIP